MCFVSPLASTLIAPAAQTIADDSEFKITNPTVTALLVSVHTVIIDVTEISVHFSQIFILGYAFGPLVAR